MEERLDKNTYLIPMLCLGVEKFFDGQIVEVFQVEIPLFSIGWKVKYRKWKQEAEK